MSKAEEFIESYTRNCSNEYLTDSKPDGLGGYISRRKFTPWLTPDQARRAVEIAREEIYEWLEENAANFVGLADNEHPAIGDTKAFYGTKSLIHYLKQAIKDE